jgi:hypothetical protein
VILAGVFMVVLDFLIVNVALPSIQARSAPPAAAPRVGRSGQRSTSAVFLIAAAAKIRLWE